MKGRAITRPTSAAQNLTGGFADFVELPQRDHFFVRGHLENTVGGSVNDGRTGAHVFRAEFLNDLSAGGGLVAERMAPDAPLEFLHDFRRKAVWAKRKWLFEMDAHHFPMAGGGVLPGRSQRASAVSTGGRRGGRDAGQRLDISEAECGHVRQMQAAKPRDVAQCIGARRVAERRCVGHGANAYTIEDDPDDATEHYDSSVTRRRRRPERTADPAGGATASPFGAQSARPPYGWPPPTC